MAFGALVDVHTATIWLPVYLTRRPDSIEFACKCHMEQYSFMNDLSPYINITKLINEENMTGQTYTYCIIQKNISFFLHSNEMNVNNARPILENETRRLSITKEFKK